MELGGTRPLLPEHQPQGGLAHKESHTSLLLVRERVTSLFHKAAQQWGFKGCGQSEEGWTLLSGRGPQHHPLFPPGGEAEALQPLSVQAHLRASGNPPHKTCKLYQTLLAQNLQFLKVAWIERLFSC